MFTISSPITEPTASDVSPVGPPPRPRVLARHRLGDATPSLGLIRRIAARLRPVPCPVCVVIPSEFVALVLPPKLRTTVEVNILCLPKTWAPELPALLASALSVRNLRWLDLPHDVTSIVITGPRRGIALDAMRLPITGGLDAEGIELFVVIVVCGGFAHVVEYKLDNVFIAALEEACAAAARNYRPYATCADADFECVHTVAPAKPDLEAGPTRAMTLDYCGPLGRSRLW